MWTRDTNAYLLSLHNTGMDVAVLGADERGRAIARVCARGGATVSLHAGDATAVMDSVDIVERRLDSAVDAGDLTPEERDGTVDRLEATTDLEGALDDATVVVETATSDEASLQARFAEIEELLDRDALVATSDPDVSLTRVAAGLRYPGRAVGLHFHRPLETTLVEVVVAEQTRGETVERAEQFLADVGRSPVVVRDTPGIASTRLALTVEREAMQMVEDGVAGIGDVDDVFEMGHGGERVLERADRAGLDSRLAMLETLAAELGPRFEPPALLTELVADGKTGAAAGEGFYTWEGGEPVEPTLPGPRFPQQDDRPRDPADE